METCNVYKCSAIKNLMSQYDKNGDWIDPNTGLTGLAVRMRTETVINISFLFQRAAGKKCLNWQRKNS